MKNEVALLVEENLKCRILGFEKSAKAQAPRFIRRLLKELAKIN